MVSEDNRVKAFHALAWMSDEVSKAWKDHNGDSGTITLYTEFEWHANKPEIVGGFSFNALWHTSEDGEGPWIDSKPMVAWAGRHKQTWGVRDALLGLVEDRSVLNPEEDGERLHWLDVLTCMVATPKCDKSVDSMVNQMCNRLVEPLGQQLWRSAWFGDSDNVDPLRGTKRPWNQLQVGKANPIALSMADRNRDLARYMKAMTANFRQIPGEICILSYACDGGAVHNLKIFLGCLASSRNVAAWCPPQVLGPPWGQH